jgi:hypothetical protein
MDKLQIVKDENSILKKISRSFDYNAELILHQVDFKNKKIYEEYSNGYSVVGIKLKFLFFRN